MEQKVISQPIGLDTQIFMLTPRQLFEMQAEWLKQHAPEPPQKSNGKERWYTNSVEELCGLLGISKGTFYKMKREGVLNDAISQYGHWMVIDVHRVLEKFKLSNKKRR